MRVLFVSSEVAPFSKTGGLADVSGALPAALSRRGLDVRVMTPFYRAVVQGGWASAACGEVTLDPGGSVQTARIREGTLPGGPPVWFVDHPPSFDRPGLYGEGGQDYPDNLERFALFCRAVLAWVQAADWVPEVIHCNDWQTALLPVYLRTSAEPLWSRVGSLLTVHNLAYQGVFPPEKYALLGLPQDLYSPRYFEFWGRVNLLKAGLVFADILSTVSETYAREIQTPELGCGLESVLRERAADLYGILNGVDYTVWDPRNDTYLPVRYGPDDLSGKATCKAALQEEVGLHRTPSVPLFGMVSRLVEQKGVDLVVACVDHFPAAGAQLVVLGTGDPRYEAELQNAGRRHPGWVAVRIGFDERLAHWIEAGCDAFLMPSRYEPSGLNQLYSLRYGTVPVVRRTGGLADSVVDATPEALERGEANGFVFEEYTPGAFWGAVQRALAAYQHRSTWEKLVRTGMSADFSWDRAAGRYVDLYRLARRRRGAVPS
ncbi:MAG: glycogen synthase GlgA [Armatimonadota bacterium]|nr:glycogen synthase GlgA [Armatimonadota bacterium]MDW8154971.1 glycogen synthase GlgA [Armatimonadota bacterium]